MKKNLVVMMIVLAAASVVTIVSILLFPSGTGRREAEILSASVTGETLVSIDLPVQNEREDVVLTEMYQAGLDLQCVAYCPVYRIDAGKEGQFEIAVGIDMSGTRVLGVRLLSDSLSLTDGSYVSWTKTDCLDVYSGLSRSHIDTVETMVSSPVATLKIKEAVKMAFETVDVRKESEDTYE